MRSNSVFKKVGQNPKNFSWNLETFQSSQSVSNKLRGMYVHHGKKLQSFGFLRRFLKLQLHLLRKS